MRGNKKSRRRGKTGRVIFRWIKRLIFLAVIVIAALFGLRAYIRNQAENAEAQTDYSTSQVMRGAMKDTVYGTGTTTARSQPNVLAEADGTLTALRVAIGDEVKQGDILAVLKNEDIDDTITDLEFSLWDLDETITDTAAGAKTKAIYAPAAGLVMAVYGQAGDDALAVFRREGALAIISTDGRMKVELTGETGALGLALDEKVTVTGENIYAEGTVVELTRQGTSAVITVFEDDLPVSADADGDGVKDALMGREVTVKNAAGEEIGTGSLEPNKPMAVSSFGGTISAVRCAVGEEVTRKQTIFTLEDSPLTLKLEDLRLQREAAAKELEDAKAQRENLVIIAPCDGVVASLEVKEGDEITSGTLIGSILHGEDMNLTISVDELDVVDVAAGQSVSITIDALSSLEMQGEVLKIAPVGSNSGGVTTYDVELTFDAAGTGVRPGMNATGEIEIASVEDTLYVPVEAIMTVNNRKFVMVADGGATVLADAASSQTTQRTGRGMRSAQTGAQGGMPNMSAMTEGGMPDMHAMTEGGMPDMSGRPERGSMGDMSRAQRDTADSGNSTQDAAQQSGPSLLERIKAVPQRLRAWLYEGVETTSAQQATGSLAPVEIGLMNDDYAEILSGVSEGDVVLYTGSEDESSSMFRGMMGMGGMGGARPMGF